MTVPIAVVRSPSSALRRPSDTQEGSLAGAPMSYVAGGTAIAQDV